MNRLMQARISLYSDTRSSQRARPEGRSTLNCRAFIDGASTTFEFRVERFPFHFEQFMVNNFTKNVPHIRNNLEIGAKSISIPSNCVSQPRAVRANTSSFADEN